MKVLVVLLYLLSAFVSQGQSVFDGRRPGGSTLRAAQRLLAQQFGLRKAPKRRIASWKHFNPGYSTFSCVGTPWGQSLDVAHGYAKSNQKFHPFRRTCRFNNICLNHTSLEYIFFHPDGDESNPQRQPLFYDFKGAAHYTFPENFVNTGNSEVAPYVFWGPNISYTSIPADAPFHDNPIHVVSAPNVLMGNLGHAIFDFLMPVFDTMQLFNSYHPDFQLVFDDQVQDYLLGTSKEDMQDIIDKFVNASEPERNILMLISNNKVVRREELAVKQPGPMSCFKSVVTGQFALETRNARVSAIHFRAAVASHLHITEQPPTNHPVITVITKKGRRIIENTQQIVDMINDKFPGAELVLLDGDQLAAMGMAEQVRAMSRTNILFTPGGGTASIAIFLPPGATAIIVNHWDVDHHTSIQMDASNFNNIDYLNFMYLPVTLEDYEGTSDRPGCEFDAHLNRNGTLKQCNVRIKDMNRVENTLRAALKRWAANHRLTVDKFTQKAAVE